MGLFDLFRKKNPAKSAGINFVNDQEATDHWTKDESVKAKFTQPGYPDDLQVIVHDGGYRFTKSKPEYIWVRVTGRSGKYFRGNVLNQPNQLKKLKQNDEIIFVIESGTQYPVMVSERYIEQMKDWKISPCDKCGLHELFDPPDDLMHATFTNMPAGARSEMFTTFCNLCGGVQVVADKDLKE